MHAAHATCPMMDYRQQRTRPGMPETADSHRIIVLSDDPDLTGWVASAMSMAGVAGAVNRLPGPGHSLQPTPQADLFVLDHGHRHDATLDLLRGLSGRLPRPLLVVLIGDLPAAMATDLQGAGADALMRRGEASALSAFASRWLPQRGRPDHRAADAVGPPHTLAGTPDAAECLTSDPPARIGEARLLDFLDLTTDGFWERDSDLLFTFVSPSAASMLGHHTGSLLGRREPEIDKAAFPDWPRLEELMRGRQTVRGMPYRLRSPDGSETTITVNADPILGDRDDLLGFRGVFARTAASSAAPTMFGPASSQCRPTRVSQPSSAVSLASRSAQVISISAR